jgi:hypothetical protein
MRPIGAPDGEWSCGYGKTFLVDGLPLIGSWGGGSYTPRAAARIGRLVLREGDWDGQRVLSPEAVRLVTRSAGLPGDCGMGWWTNAAGRYTQVPKDAYWGAGAGDQLLFIVPSLNLIMVRNGQTIAPLPGEPAVRPDDVFTKFHDVRARVLLEPLIAAIEPPKKTSAAPYPPSNLIAGIDWAPKEAIIRQARGCDNWPLTWADDGHLYGAYGDANGFEPKLPEKLSMGLARIEGGPESLLGVNLRSPTFEQKGDGAKGKKVSGMLMVEGVLYALVRNAGHAQLAWSQDYGQTWTPIVTGIRSSDFTRVIREDPEKRERLGEARRDRGEDIRGSCRRPNHQQRQERQLESAALAGADRGRPAVVVGAGRLRRLGREPRRGIQRVERGRTFRDRGAARRDDAGGMAAGAGRDQRAGGADDDRAGA